MNPGAPMKESSIEWLGEIPSHWNIERLKYLAGVNFSSVDKHIYEEEYPIFLCNDVDVYKNDFITPDINFMSATATIEEISKFLLVKGDILITKDSESWDDIGTCLCNPEL